MALAAVTAEHIPSERIGNKADLANWFGVALTTVDQWLRRGCPYITRGERGRQWQFDFLAVCKWRFGAIDDDAEDDPEKMPAKDRLDWYRGTRERTKHLQESGDLLTVADYERELSRSFKAVSVTLESLADVLERDCGIAPDAVERVQSVCDRVREGLYQRIAGAA